MSDAEDGVAKTEARVQWERFLADAARWIRPQQCADISELDGPTMLKLLVRHPPLRAMAWFRLGSAARSVGVRGFPHWTQRRLLRLYGLEISVGSDVGGGLYIAHPVACVLVGEAIGTNATVIAHVTLGTREDERWPMIGDDVFLGVGCCVLGGISVGDRARVGANAVVIHDVPDDATVVGIPARPTG